MVSQARYFDGETASHKELDAWVHEQWLVIGEGADQLRVALSDLSVDPPVGKGSWHVSFGNGASLRFNDPALGEAINQALGRKGDWVGKLEHSWGWALAALLLAVGTTWVTLTVGVPAAAKKVAFSMPAGMESTITNDGLGAADRILFDPSTTDEQTQAQLQAIFADIISDNPDYASFRLEFRASPALGANAFAVPGGLVILTDELIALSENDDELRAVLAHEVGHLANRHSMRILLQSSASAVLIASLTGDLSGISGLAAALPTFLVQSSYSRDFEREADEFSFQHLNSRGVDTDALSRLLSRIEESAGIDQSDSRVSNWLSSHPRSEDRKETD
ncbi:MAG: M48 family metallopeptidase [Pseudomonadota bacterium]